MTKKQTDPLSTALKSATGIAGLGLGAGIIGAITGQQAFAGVGGKLPSGRVRRRRRFSSLKRTQGGTLRARRLRRRRRGIEPQSVEEEFKDESFETKQERIKKEKAKAWKPKWIMPKEDKK